MPRNLELRQEGKKAFEQAQALLKKSETEKRTLTEDENRQFDAWMTETEAKCNEAARIEKIEKLAAENDPEIRAQIVGGETGKAAKAEKPKNRFGTEEYRSAFNAVLANGTAGLSAEQRATLQMDNDLGGGLFHPSEQFVMQLIQNVDNAVVIRQMATVRQVPVGQSLGFPTRDADLADFSWGAGELTAAVEDTGLKFGKREWKPQPLVRKLIKESKKLLEVSPDVEGIVTERVAISLARTLEKAYMTGTGAQQPLGLFTASADGITTGRDVTTTAAADIAADDLYDVQGTLLAQYQPDAQWLFHRTTLTKIRKLKDGIGRPLLEPSLVPGVPMSVLGKGYTLSEYAPNTYTTGLYVALYGAFKNYWIADAVGQMTMQRLLEVYATTGQVGLLFDNIACDAMPVLAEAFVRVKLL